jgi:hypothetical protein
LESLVSVLRNRRKERFAIEWAGGKTPIEAMAAAGYKPAPANARKLANSPEVKARRTELFRAHADFLSADIARALIEQARIAYSNIADFWEVVSVPAGDGGVGEVLEWRIKDVTAMPRELTAAIQKIKISKDGRPEITLFDKVAVLRDLRNTREPEQPTKPAGDQPPSYDANDNWSELTTAPSQPITH